MFASTVTGAVDDWNASMKLAASAPALPLMTCLPTMVNDRDALTTRTSPDGAHGATRPNASTHCTSARRSSPSTSRTVVVFTAVLLPTADTGSSSMPLVSTRTSVTPASDDADDDADDDRPTRRSKTQPVTQVHKPASHTTGSGKPLSTSPARTAPVTVGGGANGMATPTHATTALPAMSTPATPSSAGRDAAVSTTLPEPLAPSKAPTMVTPADAKNDDGTGWPAGAAVSVDDGARNTMNAAILRAPGTST